MKADVLYVSFVLQIIAKRLFIKYDEFDVNR